MLKVERFTSNVKVMIQCSRFNLIQNTGRLSVFFIAFSTYFFVFFQSLAQTVRDVGTNLELTNAISSSLNGDIINITNNIVISGQATISGKTITINGNGYEISVPRPGLDDMGRFNDSPSSFGVFQLSTAANVTINNLTIKGGALSSNGGAILVNSGTILKLNNSVVSNSIAGGGGGGIAVSGIMFMKNSFVRRNAARYGGGILVTGTGRAYVEESTLVENRSTSANGGGGAAECQSGSILYFNNSTLSNNQSTEIGGAINNYQGTVYFINSSATGNVAFGGFKGGAIGNNGGNLFILNSLFAYNYRRTTGTVTNPTGYILDDFDPHSNPSGIRVYHSIHHAALPSGLAINVGNVQYTGQANGSDNTIFSGGLLSKITDNNGNEIGDPIFRPFLVNNQGSVAPTLKVGSFLSQSGNRGVPTRFANNNNNSPAIAYFSGGTWTDILGTSQADQEVSLDQVGATRSNTAPTRGAIESELVATLYVVKVNGASGGTVNGGTIYGDIYPSGTSVTLTAIPSSGQQFVSWDCVAGCSGIASTSNPYIFNVTQNVTLVPVFQALPANSYTITYIGNGNTSGEVPTGGVFSAPTTISNSGSLMRDGFSFTGWNTNSNGSGVSYMPGVTYAAGSNLTLYAQWSESISNSEPTDISLNLNIVSENQAIGTTVGTLSTTDVDVSDTFTYSLVSGTGDSDNASFTISGNNLTTASVFDFETKSSYSIRVRTTDAGGLFFEKNFAITVTNVNEAPTDISLSATSVSENQAVGTTVGTLSTTDVDAGDTFTYSLVSGTGDADNAAFAISGNSLNTGDIFDFARKSSYSIRIRTTDAGGLFYEKVFTISVSDNTAPTLSLPTNSSRPADNNACGYVVQGTEFDPISVTDNSGSVTSLSYSVQRVLPNPGLVSENFNSGEWNASNFEIGSPTGGVVNGAYRSTGGGDDRGTLRTVSDFVPTPQNPLYVTATLRFNGTALAFIGTRSDGLKDPTRSNEPTNSQYFRIHNFNDGQTNISNTSFDGRPGDAFYNDPVIVRLVDNGSNISGSITNTVTNQVLAFDENTSFSSGSWKVVFSGGEGVSWDDIKISLGKHEYLQEVFNGTNSLAGQTLSVGQNTIIWTAQDAAGNVASESLVVTVSDTQKPSLQPSADVNTTSLVGEKTKALLITNAVVADNCSVESLTWTMTGATTATGTGQIGTFTFNTGLTTVTYTAVDPSGNTEIASFTVSLKETQEITFGTLANQIYGDDDFDLTASVSSGLPVTFESSDSTVATISGNTVSIIGAGTVTITAKQAGEDTYEAANPVQQTLTINKKGLSITAYDKQKIYGEANPTLSFSYDGLVNGDTKVSTEPSISTTATASSPVGSYAIKLAGGSDANYDITLVDGTLTVNKKALTITADDKQKIYGSANPALTFSYDGLVNGDTKVATEPSISTTATASSNVGDYPISLIGGADQNYAISLVNGTLTVDKKALTITADDKQKIYGEANPALSFTYNGLVNGDTKVAAEPTISTAATASSPVGSYAITLSGGSDANYNITMVDGTLTVDKKALTITADDKQKIYGEANPALSFTYNGLVNGDTKVAAEPTISTAATASSAVGGYAITLSGGSDANYNISLVDGTLTVDKKALTITADDKQKIYGEANPTFTFSYDGLTNGDTKIATGPSISTTATVSSNVGTYPITLTGGADANYDITLKNGSILVDKARLIVEVLPIRKVFGTADPVLEFTVSGFVLGQGRDLLRGQLLRQPGEELGTYSISLGTLSAGDNYLISFEGGSFDIVQTVLGEMFEIVPAVVVDVFEETLVVTPWNVSPVLPATVPIMTEDGGFYRTGVSWNLSSLNILKRGEYALEGALANESWYTNPTPVIARQRVVVQAKPAPQDLLLDNRTFEAQGNEYFLPVGRFTVQDPVDGIHVVELVPGALDNAYFEIKDGILFWSSAERAEGRTTFTIQVRVTDRDDNVIERQFMITRNRQSVTSIEVFNTFTPNGDGTNDTWGVPDLRYYQGVRIQVFDRGGDRMFYTENPDVRWDGTFKGRELPVGTYYWTIEVRETGETRRGMLNLFRK